MIKDSEIIKIYLKTQEKFCSIENTDDLRKNKLTLAEYHMLENVLNNMFSSPEKRTYCFNSSVAEWCKRTGLKVIASHPDTEQACVNYIVSVF